MVLHQVKTKSQYSVPAPVREVTQHRAIVAKAS